MKVYTNGKIYTVNENRDWAEAVVTDGNRIVYVGDDAGAKAFAAGTQAEIVDLEGKLMLPGLIDGHCHPVMGAVFKAGIILNGFYTLDEMLAEIKRYIQAHPNKEYYSGKGFEEIYFVENGIEPDRSMLDSVCNDTPILIFGTSGHVAWCNSCALEKAGITAETPDPYPGRSYFARDTEGNPTGYIVENMATTMVTERVEVLDMDEVNASMMEISEQYAANGVTSLCDMGGISGMIEYMKTGLLDLAEKGQLKQRFDGCGAMVNSIEEVDAGIVLTQELNSKANSDLCKFSFVKLFIIFI